MPVTSGPLKWYTDEEIEGEGTELPTEDESKRHGLGCRESAGTIALTICLLAVMLALQ